MTSIVLTKGANVNLTKDNPGLDKLRCELSWDANPGTGPAYDLDASAVILNGNGKLLDANQKNFVYFGNKKSPDGSVYSSGDNLTGAGEGPDETIFIELSKLPTTAEQVDIFVTIYEAGKRHQNFGQVPKSGISMKDDRNGTVLATYDLQESFSTETALHIGSIYKKDGEWKFRAVGAGYAREIGDFFAAYAA